MTRRSIIVLCGVCTLAVAAAIAARHHWEKPVSAQTPPTGYEQLVLCSMPGATKAEGASATGITSLFAETFTVRTRNWRWLSEPQMWHGEWWLRDSSGGWSWVPVATRLTCSYYPDTLDTGWIVP